MAGTRGSVDATVTIPTLTDAHNDAIATRVQWEHDCYERASQRALLQYQQRIDAYSRLFGQRVGKILQDPEASLPPLPPEFLEIGDETR